MHTTNYKCSHATFIREIWNPFFFNSNRADCFSRFFFFSTFLMFIRMLVRLYIHIYCCCFFFFIPHILSSACWAHSLDIKWMSAYTCMLGRYRGEIKRTQHSWWHLNTYHNNFFFHLINWIYFQTPYTSCFLFTLFIIQHIQCFTFIIIIIFLSSDGSINYIHLLNTCLSIGVK